MLLDQLQTEYRDRFIRQEYVWILKYDPRQPRDKAGRWVLDKSGQLLTVYHGSVSPDVTGSKLNPNQPPVRPRSGPNGIYFTSNAQSAYNYIRMPGAGIKGPKGRVIPANIRMNNPLDITDAIKKGRKKGLSFGEAKRKALDALTPDHDGVIFRGDAYNPDEYIVFSAEQIRPLGVKKWDESKHPRDKEGQWTTSGVPKEPGTTPIPPGKIRGYHYTDNLEAVGKEGLQYAKARGQNYGEPNAIWFSTVKPGDFKEYVEVFLDPSEVVQSPLDRRDTVMTPEVQKRLDDFNAGNHDFMTNVNAVSPDRFVTVHQPWHDRYRYIAKESNKQLQEEILAGEHDALLTDPEYGPAVKLFKEQHAKKVKT